MARQQQLHLEADQPARHLEIVGRLVQSERVNRREKLVGDPRDRNVGDVDLLLAHQVQQQVERTGEAVELHDEAARPSARSPAVGVQGGGHH